MVFCVKYRKNLLLGTELVNFLKNVCFEISERYCFAFDAIGSDGDHGCIIRRVSRSRYGCVSWCLLFCYRFNFLSHGTCRKKKELKRVK